MKRIVILGMSALLALSVLPATLVYAETAGTTTTTTQTQTTNAIDDAKSMQLRLEKRKTDYKVKLTTAEKATLQLKCKAAQGSVSSLKGRVKGLDQSRSEVYKNMVSRLTDLSDKLKSKGSDTKTYDAAVAVLKTKITTFDSDLAVYKQDVIDLADMDCKLDPDGFKASLQAARADQELVAKDSAAVRTQLNDVIKPLLKTIRGTLDTAKTGGN